ncbi:MAG: hypothetical protein IIB37_09715 [Gemmatimonadetes bacterium]|nr:hypothetical protein [Gemmatimonadota bacterium]MCH8810787.1 hypothetical protein [Gemmatimonadota bacterium]
MSEKLTTVRLLFVDDGSFHHEEVQIPAGAMAGYERLIDCLMEDPAVLKRLHVDVSRVCSAELAGP